MLTLQYVPYIQIQALNSEERINKLLNIISDNKIILLEGKLKKEEEANLIRRTMEMIGQNDDNFFKGIELSTVDPEVDDLKFFSKLKSSFVNLLLGDRKGITIVGPASIVKEIKQDPEKIELLINNLSTNIGSVKSNSAKKTTRKRKTSMRKK